MSYQFIESDGGREATGFTNENRDCTVRALTHFAGIDYAAAHAVCKRAGRIDGRGMYTGNIKRAIKEVTPTAEYTYVTWRKDRPTMAQFAKANPKGTFYILLARHACVLKDGVLLDSWKVGARCRVQAFFKLPEEASHAA